MATPAAEHGQPAAMKKDLIGRMIGAARLDVHTFEDVENDSTATSQALMVVVIVSLASGIGLGLATTISGVGGAGSLISSLVFGILRGLVGWALWALLTFVLGTTLFKTEGTHASWSQLARTTGFAQSPGVFVVLVFIPIIGWLIALLASIWQVVAMVIAVRQALDYKDTLRAVGVVVVGFIIIFVLQAVFSNVFGVRFFSGVAL